jgi:hypothetical protein
MSIPNSDSGKSFLAGLGQGAISTFLFGIDCQDLSQGLVVKIILHFIEKRISTQKRFFVNSEKL